MMNETFQSAEFRAHDPEWSLALSYAPADRRGALAALLALDETLGQILRTTREPLVGQMRLTWWFEALEALDRAPPPAQPVLRALAAEMLPRGVRGAELAAMIDGWETLLDPEPLTEARLIAYAHARGATVFVLAARALDASDPVEDAGIGWALADLASHVADAATASHARALAAAALRGAFARRWSRAGRSLGALAMIARMDLATPLMPPRIGAPQRVARLAWHRLTGR